MKNPELRKELIEKGKFKNYSIKRKELIDVLGYQEFSELSQDEQIKLYSLNPNEIAENERIRSCKKKQRDKIKDHITFLFDTNTTLFFATFTFNDKTLKTTKRETRKRVLTRLLKNFDDYIINIDYGTENEREHYHAILSIKKPNIFYDETNHIKIDELEKYNYGFYHLEEIRRDEIDKKRLSEYITKLTFHSIKVAQSYVSVKKGSNYQKWKEIKEMAKDQGKKKTLFRTDLDDEFYYLIS